MPKPKILTTLDGYDRRQFAADVSAGVIVGIVALPLAIAFAIASGVTPDRGLYTAIIAGFLISLLGGSRVQIGGPTGAFVVIVYGIVHQHGIDGLVLATLMAGAMLVVFGLVRMGAAIKFIPYPVVMGFTTGIAVIIFSTQVKDLLGLQLEAVPPEFVEQWRAYAAHAGSVDPWSVAVAAATLLILALWPRLTRRIPGSLVAILLTSAVVASFDLPVETIGSRFGEIQAQFPRPSLPAVSLERLTLLFPSALAIALLAGIESLLSAVVSDGMIGGRHRSNIELVAQGVANILTPLFGGIPATGALARTATNVNNGGRTPIAGIVHALTLLGITLFFGRWAALIPLPAIAAILVIVAYHMSDWRSFRSELRAPRSDVAVLVTTFLLTVFVDLTVAIQVGMVLAAFLFMRRMSEVTNVTMLTREFVNGNAKGDALAESPALPRGVVVYEINGPFFFGAAEKFRETLAQIAGKPRVLIVRMRDVPAMDSTGMHALRELIRRSRSAGTVVLLSEVHAQPLVAIDRSGLLEELGEEQLYGSFEEAIERARLESSAREAREETKVSA